MASGRHDQRLVRTSGSLVGAGPHFTLDGGLFVVERRCINGWTIGPFIGRAKQIGLPFVRGKFTRCVEFEGPTQ